MIDIKKHSGIYTLTSEQQLPISIEEAWNFFSSPKNLAEITPKNMGFVITSELPPKAYTGQIITYKIGILFSIKTSWVTEITHVEHLSHFIDEQRFGPYSMWHHEHFFTSLPNGNTLMKDKVSYKIPLGILGHLAHVIFVKKQLLNIFKYRFDTLNKKFG
ncbi:MAG: SRPBCC family protein [Flavipsychrobacter sp.]